jgi:hypothetical protein
MSIVLNSTGGGSVTIQEPSTASNLTATLPAATGTVMVSGNMPAFGAFSTVNQSVSSATFTKVTLNNEEFDTASCFDSTTNYRFTPNVAGYYQINAAVVLSGTAVTRFFCSIYKNGSEYKRGNDLLGSGYQPVVSSVLYLNGTTDYVELYAIIYGSSGLAIGTGTAREVYMNGFLARTA